MYNGVHFSPDRPDPDNITRIDLGALPLIGSMHYHGIRIDVPFLNSLSKRYHSTLDAIEFESRLVLGSYQDSNGKGVRTPFKITSPDHVSRLLFEHLKVQGLNPVPMTEKGARFATSDDVLQMFSKQHPIIPMILEHRGLSKLCGTYVDALPRLVDSDSRVHTTFNTTLAATGRLSSSNPNLQNIPVRSAEGKEIRRAFIASPGNVLVSNDLSQIEMVWAAHRSKDPVMMDVFFKKQDVHTRTACIVFGLDYERMMALKKLVDDEKGGTLEQQKEYKYFKSYQRLPCKTTGFGVLYGQTAEGLQASLVADGVMWSLEQCQKFIDESFFGVYKKLREMLERDYARAYRYGMVWDDLGRVRLVPEAKSALKHIRNEGARKAGNHPEQGGAQETIKLSMAELTPMSRELMAGGDVCLPLLQIHDQLIWEVNRERAKDWAAEVQEVLVNATPLDVPVGVSSDIGETWKDL